VKVAVVAGICVDRDAISNAVVEQLAALRQSPDIDSVTLFTQGCNRDPGVEVVVESDPWRMIVDPRFEDTDVAIFHWGIAYELFDALVIAPTAARRCAVHFHNVTPPELLTGHDRDKSMRSLTQAASLPDIDADVWTFSEYNRRTLLDWGVGDDRLFHVPIAIRTPIRVDVVRRVDAIELLTVGRLVPAKGVHVLVDAIALLPAASRRRIHLTVAGNLALSDARYVADVRGAISSNRLDDIIELRDDPSPVELGELYSRAHAVVSPSFHEGLCIPIIEGYLAGCRAIGSTAGNLPFAIFDPDPIVPAGDPEALAGAIEALAGDVLAGIAVDRTAACSYAAGFSPATAARHLLERVLASAPGIGADPEPDE
jgi:glycosyltransferase involved in cell wall biosynthesis